MQKEQSDLRLCLITFPLPKIQGGHIGGKLSSILDPLTNQITLITGNYPRSAIFSPKIDLKSIKYENKQASILIKILRNAITQIKMCFVLTLKAGKIHIVILFVEGTTLILPMILAKLLGKRTIIIATGSGKRGAEKQFKKAFWGYGGKIFSRFIALLEQVNRKLANRIVIESPALTWWLELGRLKNKTFTQGALFVDIDHFAIKTRTRERRNVVAYIGRLSEEKGVFNFVRAIPLMIYQRSDIEFLICGNGGLLPELEKELESYMSKVRFVGWIAHEKLPDYLNETKLLVVPSYTEGLPNIILEAMSCGAMVLATPVGGIPDVVMDRETGFIMANNSPVNIAAAVLNVLNLPNAEQITDNARGLVENKFTYEAAVDRYRKILSWR